MKRKLILIIALVSLLPVISSGKSGSKLPHLKKQGTAS